VVGQGSELVADILMKQMSRAQPNGNKQQRLQKLIGCNQHQPLIVMAATGEDLQWGADHDPWGSFDYHCASSYVK
jgi:hypothetical protein